MKPLSNLLVSPEMLVLLFLGTLRHENYRWCRVTAVPLPSICLLWARLAHFGCLWPRQCTASCADRRSYKLLVRRHSPSTSPAQPGITRTNSQFHCACWSSALRTSCCRTSCNIFDPWHYSTSVESRTRQCPLDTEMMKRYRPLSPSPPPRAQAATSYGDPNLKRGHEIQGTTVHERRRQEHLAMGFSYCLGFEP